MGQNFLGIQIPSSSATVPTPAVAGQKTSGMERNVTNVIDLRSSSPGPSATQAIAGSEVSVASTRSNNGTGENQNSFPRMMTGAGAMNSAQTFANVQ